MSDRIPGFRASVPSAAIRTDASTPVVGGDGLAARLEALGTRHRRLQDMVIRAQAEEERLTAERNTMEAEALTDFGTSDPKALRLMADKMEAEDIKRADEFERKLADAEAILATLTAEASASSPSSSAHRAETRQ